jgi:acyl-CoA thioesterase I
VTRALIAVLLLHLCACNRSGEPQDSKQPPGSPAQHSAAATPSEADARPVIVAFGDSITAGFGVSAGSSYPDVLQRELDSRGYRYRVVNAGVSGDTTSGGAARISGVTALKPEIVILELGGNDGLRGLPLDTTRANLESMILSLKAEGAEVVLAGMTLPPNYGPEYVPKFEQIYRDLARKHGLKLIPLTLEGVAGTDLVQEDGLHPTAEGSRRIAETILKTIESSLQRK